ncbi:MAG: GtrA family protein [Oscillospiraceae bacterium]|nr:GtrA family protein [Oscillospiraceae bacterium]
MIQKAMDLYRKYREMILYLVFGGLTTLVNILSYFVLTDLGHVNYLVSTAIAWVLSVLFAYFTNRVWVFQSTASGAQAILTEMGSFFGCRLLSGVIDMAIMFLCVSLLKLPDKLIKILANIVVIILNYLFSKLFIFKKGKGAQQ